MRVPHLSPTTLTTDEQRLILHATAGNVRDHLIFSMSLETGLRLAELVGLNVDDPFTGELIPPLRGWGLPDAYPPLPPKTKSLELLGAGSPLPEPLTLGGQESASERDAGRIRVASVGIHGRRFRSRP